MNSYLKRLFSRNTNPPTESRAIDDFFEWLTHKELAPEKEIALFDLWKKSTGEATADTLFSLSDILSRKQKKKEKTDSLRRPLVYISLIVLLILMPWYLIFTKTAQENARMVEFYSSSSLPEKHLLPDGSIVHTNAATLLLYPESFGEDTRTVYLVGEANFKVLKNGKLPFVVKSGDFSVTALGTEFDVSAYSDEYFFKTTLIEGAIRVSRKSRMTDITLDVGEQFYYDCDSKNFYVSEVNLSEATAWQRGELLFRGATIREILRVLERRYPVSFQYKLDVLNDDRYNFRFNQEAELEEILNIMRDVSDDFDYQIKNGSYYITNR